MDRRVRLRRTAAGCWLGSTPHTAPVSGQKGFRFVPNKETLKKKRREHKESKGSARGAKRTKLTEGEKVRMGKGMYVKFSSLGKGYRPKRYDRKGEE